jgi:hypothetical protein
MERKLMTTSLAVIALMSWSTVGWAQSAAEKPTIVVGDRWDFTSTNMPSGKPGTWSRTVMEVSGEDHLKVRLGEGNIADYDGGMDWMPKGNADYRRQLVSYPLTLGKEWAIAMKYESPNWSETGKAKVVAFEELSVPAGTFKCFRIDAETSLVNKTYSHRRFWNRWYCPETKWIAKEIVESRIFHPTDPQQSGTTILTSELVRFTPGK